MPKKKLYSSIQHPWKLITKLTKKGTSILKFMKIDFCHFVCLFVCLYANFFHPLLVV